MVAKKTLAYMKVVDSIALAMNKMEEVEKQNSS